MRCGTAKGSILGPLIYIIYVNDVLGILGQNERSIYLYGDNMLILASHNNVENMMSILQRKLAKIFKWCMENKLTVNETKTKYMIVKNLRVETISNISIGNHVLDRVSQYEYLGMIMHEKLNMDVQIESMYKKANKKLQGFVFLLQKIQR